VWQEQLYAPWFFFSSNVSKCVIDMRKNMIRLAPDISIASVLDNMRTGQLYCKTPFFKICFRPKAHGKTFPDILSSLSGTGRK
jgi:hypothetical protein